MLFNVFVASFCSIIVTIFSSEEKHSFMRCNNCTSFFHSVMISRSVVLTCSDVAEVPNDWFYNKVILNVFTHIIRARFQESLFVFDNFSLSIHNVSYFHEGVYRCCNNDSVLVEHTLHVIGSYC